MPTTHVEIYDPFGSDEFIVIEKVEVLGTPKLKVTFSDGVIREIDFTKTIGRNHWFVGLKEPLTFETVEIINEGRGLQWITGVDYCADALRILGDKQLAGQA